MITNNNDHHHLSLSHITSIKKSYMDAHENLIQRKCLIGQINPFQKNSLIIVVLATKKIVLLFAELVAKN